MRKDCVLEIGVQPLNVDERQRRADGRWSKEEGVCSGQSIRCRNIDDYRVKKLNRIQQDMIILADVVGPKCGPEVAALKGIHILGIANISSPEFEVGSVEYRGLCKQATGNVVRRR